MKRASSFETQDAAYERKNQVTPGCVKSLSLTSDSMIVCVKDTVFVGGLHKKAALVHCSLYKLPTDDIMMKHNVCFHSYTDYEPPAEQTTLQI